MHKAIALLTLGTGLLTGCSAVTAGRAVPADAAGPRTVRVTELPWVLLDVDRINAIMEATGMVVNHSRTTMDEFSARLSNPDCVAAFLPIEEIPYTGSGWLAMRSQSLRNGDEGPSAIQAVVAFPSRQRAQEFFTRMTGEWQRCGDQSVQVSYRDDRVLHWHYQPVHQTENTLSLVQDTIDAGGHWSCQRALRVANNVVIDVLACRGYLDDEAVTIAGAIDDRLPTV